MIKKIAIALTLFLAQVATSYAVELALTNDILNILNSKKICVRVSLSPQDQAIYGNSLNFSIDCPEMSIKSWKCKQAPSMQYVARFKHVKKVYAEPLDFEINLNLESCENSAMLKALRESNLYFSCIVLDKNGSSRPASSVKALDDGFSSVDTTTYKNNLTIELIKTFTKSYLCDNYQSTTTPQASTKIAPEPANLIIDNLKDIWRKIITKLKNFFLSINYILLYLIVSILALLMLVIRLRFRITNPWLIEICRFLVICCFLSTYSFSNALLTQAVFFTSFAILLTPISMYYIFTARTNTILDKIKSLVGFVLAASILPLLIKAYISLRLF